MKACKFCWALSLVLILALGALAFQLVVRGDVRTSEDGRNAIHLTSGERDFVLGEMRAFLESVQGVAQGLVDQDMAGIAKNARAVGMGATGNETLALMGKLPLEFKMLGMSTHKAFDILTLEAEGLGNAEVVLGQLADILLKCTTCHAGYKFVTDSE